MIELKCSHRVAAPLQTASSTHFNTGRVICLRTWVGLTLVSQLLHLSAMPDSAWADQSRADEDLAELAEQLGKINKELQTEVNKI